MLGPQVARDVSETRATSAATWSAAEASGRIQHVKTGNSPSACSIVQALTPYPGTLARRAIEPLLTIEETAAFLSVSRRPVSHCSKHAQPSARARRIPDSAYSSSART